MPKYSIQNIRAPRRFDVQRYTRQAANFRMERAGDMLQTLPAEFSLNIKLMLEHPTDEKRIVYTSAKNRIFKFDAARLQWMNTAAVAWESTINCRVIGVSLWHPVTGEELLRIVTTEADLMPGDVFTLDTGHVIVDGEAFRGKKFPREDYMIYEEPEEKDWQGILRAELRKPPRKSRRKKTDDIAPW